MAACTESHAASLSAPGQIDFHDAFRLVDTLRLEQTDDSRIIRVSGIDVRPSDGAIVLSDPSESVVRLYGPDGKLWRTMGTRGSQPGEFRLPITPTFDAQGRIHVFDGRLMRLSVFNDRGAWIRDVSLASRFLSMQGGLVLPDGRYAVLANRLGSAKVLFELDSSGRIVDSLLPLAGVNPTGRKPSSLWDNVRWNSLTRRGDQLFVVSSLLDSVWTVYLPHNAVSSAHVAVAPYHVPSVPRFKPISVPGIHKWASQQMLAMGAFATDSGFLIPFVTGTYNDGAPSVLAYQNGTSPWQTLRNAPPIVGTAGRRLIAIATPGRVPPVFAVYERTP